MYNRYVESARVNFLWNHGKNAAQEEARKWRDLVSPRGLGLILKSITTEFKLVRHPLLDEMHLYEFY